MINYICIWGLSRWVGELQSQNFFRSCRLIFQINFRIPKPEKAKCQSHLIIILARTGNSSNVFS